MRATVRTDRGERPAGRAELPAKERASGRMQRPAELVPIPEYYLGIISRFRAFGNLNLNFELTNRLFATQIRNPDAVDV